MRKTFSIILSAFCFIFMAGVLNAQNDHYPQYMQMGNRALDGNQYDLAIDYFQSALDDNPDCWQAYVGLGNCYYYQKKLKDSLKAYEQALKMKPENEDLVKFINFLRSKLEAPAKPTMIPIVIAKPTPGFTPIPPSVSVSPISR